MKSLDDVPGKAFDCGQWNNIWVVEPALIIFPAGALSGIHEAILTAS